MKSLSKSGLALVLATTLFATSIAPASADYYYWRRRGGGWGRGPGVAAGVAAGIIGLGILGAAARDRYYYDRYYYGPGYPPPPPGYVPGYAPAYGPNCHPGPVECRTVTPPCFINRFGDQVCPAPQQQCAERPICR
jgi:hypothetical protein